MLDVSSPHTFAENHSAKISGSMLLHPLHLGAGDQFMTLKGFDCQLIVGNIAVVKWNCINSRNWSRCDGVYGFFKLSYIYSRIHISIFIYTRLHTYMICQIHMHMYEFCIGFFVLLSPPTRFMLEEMMARCRNFVREKVHVRFPISFSVW